jgi:Spy/CpxP family protein refolding chaperone
MTEQNSRPEQPPRATRLPNNPTLIIAAIALVAGLSGALVTKAFSQGPGGFGPSFMHHGPMTQAQIEDRADKMVRHLAVEVDATNEQQEKLRGIMRAAVKDVVPVAERAHGARQQARDLLAAPTINRADLEKLRADQIGTADAVSKRIVQAIADAAEVLTPEQRKKLSERFPPHGGFWRPWHRG